MKKLILFAPIAEREVHFYLEYAEHVKKLAVQDQNQLCVQFISFFEPGNSLIENKGFTCWNLYKFLDQNRKTLIDYDKIRDDFGIENLHRLILHEKVTFGIDNAYVLHMKFQNYLYAIKDIITNIEQQNKDCEIFVFQELGGFIAPLSLYYNCMKAKIQHIFFEPSFFKSHMHFVENSLNFSFLSVDQIPPYSNSAANIQKVEHYFNRVRQNKNLVIVKKDLHHYKDMGIFKLINYANLEKLFKKNYYKYIKKHRQEYDWVANHVLRSIKQFVNRRRIGMHYKKTLPEKFIYFPFHVQLDYQLTIRNPEYLNQIAFVNYLCEICPPDFKIVVKEHPITIGGFDHYSFKKLIKMHSNLIVLQPMLNTHDIVDKSKAVVTINSKVGAESLIYSKNVACLGNGFYWNSGVVTKLDTFDQLEKWLTQLAQNNIVPPSESDIKKYFAYVLEQSYEFELYNHQENNLSQFKKSMDSYLKI